MDFQQLHSRVSEVLARHQRLGLPEELVPIDCVRASEVEIVQAELALGVRLPERYREFMLRYGGGSFASLDIVPVAAMGGVERDLISVNTRDEMFAIPFIAVAPVGTGDWWGFEVLEGGCRDQVSFYSFEDRVARTKYRDFLEFVAIEGLLVEEI
jgi:hypothetical protein